MLKAVDTITDISPAKALALRQAGVDAFFGYLGPWSKCFPPVRVKVLLDAGFWLGSFFEANGTGPAAFSAATGRADAQLALTHAKNLGQPKGSGICPAVDYDAQPQDFDRIRAYLNGWWSVIGGMYKLGLYGNPAVLEAFRGEVDYLIQPSAWSGNIRVPGIAAYQHSVSTTLAGISVDIDEVYDVSILWNREGVGKLPDQTPADVKGTQWEAVANWAVQNGIMYTYTDGTFKPDEPISRGQVASSLRNLFNLLKK